jgi:hypothetical protein
LKKQEKRYTIADVHSAYLSRPSWGQKHRGILPMKKKTVIISAASFLLLASMIMLLCWVLQGGCEKKLVASYSEPQLQWREIHGPLVRTHWKQDGPYAAFAPGHELLGCWSVAFAQVLAFHRLQPSGKVNYMTRSRVTIDAALDSLVDWDRIVEAIGPDTPPESLLETARYCYHMAVVVQKDFGLGEYMNIARVPDEVEEHYGCKVEKVERDIAETTRVESKEARPLVAYFDDILGVRIVRTGHAAIFDGTALNNGRMYVHVNFGWGGGCDGWYDFRTLSKERKLRYVFRVVPPASRETGSAKN